MKYHKLMQVIETTKSEAEAVEIHSGLTFQLGYVAGRILAPPERGWWEPGATAPSIHWRVQAFFDGVDELPLGDCGMDGCLIVLVPDNLLRSCAGDLVHAGRV